MARRKMTEPAEIDVPEGLPDLSERDQNFVFCLCRQMTASDAFRQSYAAENWSNNAIWVAASRLKAKVEVRLWLDALRDSGFRKVSRSKDEHLAELERLKGIAVDSGNVGAAVQAEQLVGKVEGHYIEKHADVTPVSPQQTLEEIAAIDPNLAATLARQNGINWHPEHKETQ